VLATADSIPDAVAALTRSTEIDSTSKNAAVAFRQLGYYALLAKDWGQAIELLERSASINDKDVSTLVWLGQGYANSGNRGKAVEAFRKVLVLDPANVDAKNGMKALGT